MLMTTLLPGGPPLAANFFSRAAAAGFSSYNAVSGAAGKGGGAGSRENMMARASGRSLGADSRENQSDKDVDVTTSNTNSLTEKTYVAKDQKEEKKEVNTPEHLQQAKKK